MSNRSREGQGRSCSGLRTTGDGDTGRFVLSRQFPGDSVNISDLSEQSSVSRVKRIECLGEHLTHRMGLKYHLHRHPSAVSAYCLQPSKADPWLARAGGQGWITRAPRRNAGLSSRLAAVVHQPSACLSAPCRENSPAGLPAALILR